MTSDQTKLSMITMTRDDLFDVFHRLGAAIDPALLEDAGQPLMVSVRGSEQSGKKIATDALRAVLMAGATTFTTGKPGFDEYAFAEKNGKWFEVTYVDATWRHDFSSDFHAAALRDKEPDFNKFKSKFMAARTKGGMAVIQNGDDIKGADLEIWFEKPMPYHVMPRGGRTDQRVYNTGEDFSRIFNWATWDADRSSWVRYIEINIVSERLKADPVLQKAVEELSRGAAKVMDALAQKDKSRMPNRPYQAQDANLPDIPAQVLSPRELQQRAQQQSQRNHLSFKR